MMAVLCAASAAAQEASPLEASLRRGVGEASFFVDQPAYVAVFELIPGNGVQQLFPRSSHQASQAVPPGEYLLSRPLRSGYGYYGWNHSQPYARPIFMADAGGRVVSYYYSTGWTGDVASDALLAAVRTVLLVASRSPLRLVGSPDAAQHWLQQVIGFRAVSSAVFVPSAMLSDIVDAVLPVGADADDVVVDVLEISDYELGMRRWAGQSIAFVCPTGVTRVPAEFFFGTGVFYCPAAPRAGTPTSTQPPPSDTVTVEELQHPARKVPDKYQVEESAVQHRRAIVSTPVAPQARTEEAYQPFRRPGETSPEAVRAYGRGVWTSTVSPRATISVGVPVEPVQGRRVGGDITVSEAYVPRTVRTVQMEHAERSRWSGGGDRSTSTGTAMGTGGSAGTASSGSTVAAPPSSPSTQAERSAAAREAVSAARPAASKPNPDPPQR
jgi:hypothetical protein